MALAALLLSGRALRSESSRGLRELEQQVALVQGAMAELRPITTSVIALTKEVGGLRQSIADLQQRMPAQYSEDRPDFALASMGARVVGSSATLLPRSLRLLQHISRLVPSLLTLADQVRLSINRLAK